MDNNTQTIFLNYIFIIKKNRERKEFKLLLDKKTLSLAEPIYTIGPKWTELTFNQCSNCPLKESEHKYCPIALNISEILPCFNNYTSIEEVTVQIETEDRTYIKNTHLQHGLSSLIGIYMVTSGCPNLDKLRPLVRSHLPFANAEETMYRVTSMYLLAQYYKLKNGLTPDWEMKHLIDIYKEINIVNKDFADRLSKICETDASCNALIILDCFASNILFSLIYDQLSDLEFLFKSYIEK